MAFLLSEIRQEMVETQLLLLTLKLNQSLLQIQIHNLIMVEIHNQPTTVVVRVAQQGF